MNKKSIIIIGATSGIGKALFENYANNGNRLGIVGRRTNLLDELRCQHTSNTYTATADITKRVEAEQAICQLYKELGNFDLAIVCSGRGDQPFQCTYHRRLRFHRAFEKPVDVSIARY